MTLHQLIRKINHRRIDAGRSLVLKTFRLLFDRKLEGTLAQGKLKILMLRLDGKVGDSITTSFLINELLDAGHSVTALLNPQTAFLYKSNSNIQIIELPKGFWATLAFCLTHRAQYDVGINTSHIVTARVLFLMRFLNIAFRIGFASNDFAIFNANALFDVNKDQVLQRYRKTLEILNITAKKSKYSLDIPTPIESNADSYIKTLKQKYSKIVILNSFAGARMRSLSAESSKLIVEKILQSYPKALIVSIGNNNDLPRAAKFIEQAPHLATHWVVSPSPDFFFNAALVKAADLVISPDTAIVHLCSAFEKNLVALYRTDLGAEKNSLIWAPIHKNVKIIYSKDLGKPEQDINDIDLDAVVDAAVSFLKA